VYGLLQCLKQGVNTCLCEHAAHSDLLVFGRTGVTTRGTVRNYREALLKAPAKPLAGSAEAEGGARKRVATASTWRPAIVVQVT
jgi:hypothetical protein